MPPLKSQIVRASEKAPRNRLSRRRKKITKKIELKRRGALQRALVKFSKLEEIQYDESHPFSIIISVLLTEVSGSIHGHIEEANKIGKLKTPEEIEACCNEYLKEEGKLTVETLNMYLRRLKTEPLAREELRAYFIQMAINMRKQRANKT